MTAVWVTKANKVKATKEEDIVELLIKEEVKALAETKECTTRWEPKTCREETCHQCNKILTKEA